VASTYSNLKIQLMATGENTGTWGNVTNDNLGTAIEQALVETATVTFSSANVTLTLTDTNAAQDARALRLNLTGTTGGARDLIVPAIQKPYIVNNGTADTITVKVSGQTGVAVPAGRSYLLYNNGTDVVNALVAISPESGGTGLNAPGSSGNILTSNGTAWLSQAPVLFDAGTRMIFAQTTAPTGWTKDAANYDNHALRVVTGSASTGGSVDFTTAFTSQTPTGTVTVTASTGQTAQGGTVTVSASTGAVTQGGSVSVSASVGNTTLSTPTIPSHNHSFPIAAPGAYPSGPRLGADIQNGFQTRPLSTSSTGGGGAHAHPISAPASFTGQPHSHPVSAPASFSGQQHSHPVSAPATFSGSAINLAVKYLDVITATKN
jgi:hypothetical protein